MMNWGAYASPGDDQGTLVALTTELTPELEREGLSNDLTRHLQELRKTCDFELQDRITVRVETDSEAIKAMLAEWQGTIADEILCTDWQEGLGEGESHSIEVRGETLKAQMARVG